MKDLSAVPAIKSTCPYCGVGCGVLLSDDGRDGLTVKGDPDHPANQGRLCSKGTALGDTLSLSGRLLRPQIAGTDATWDRALDLVAERFAKTIKQHGPDSVAFYVSGQLLTEDYYVANKLIKGFMGTANIDTNSRLCMASTVAGHKRAFGTDTVPGVYEDLEQTDLLILTGSNLAWCHPVLFQRVVAARKANPNMRVVTIDPRRTATAEISDLHLGLEPGSDVALFNYLLGQISRAGAVDHDFVQNHVQGFDDAVATALASDPSQTGLSAQDLATFAEWFIGTEKVVTVFSQGVNQSSSGTDKVNSILNCHLATGRIGRPGMGPFSVTGQPNAMGGREVGGLANMLACHLDLENEAHRNTVQTFWDAPHMPTAPGLKAVDMFNAVADGRIKALWIMCTNPAVSMPDAGRVADAIAKCDFTVVSDMFGDTDTAKLATVVLPATGWAEKDGTVTNSDRTVSRQRGVLPPPGEARHDWDIMADVGRRMGWTEAFDFTCPADVFREYAMLSGLAARHGRDFDISGLQAISNAEYDDLTPTRWPITKPGESAGRMFADGQFFTPNGRARMLALTPRAPAARVTPAYPFRLNTGRVRDQWHTMTRTARAHRLNQHIPEPFCEIHPDDAAVQGLRPSDLVRLTSPHGECIVRVMITDKARKGSVFAPMHWTGQYAPSGRIDELVAPVVDPVSGQPESKASIVRVEQFQPAWYGFAVAATDFTPDCAYWAKAPIAKGTRAELAGEQMPETWEEYARQLFGDNDSQVISMTDPARGAARIALMRDGVVVAALFAGPEPIALSRAHLSAHIADAGAELLSGWPGADQPDPGATVCACFSVGINTITGAIASQRLSSVEDIGAALQAGTSCGSCRPELQSILDNFRIPEAAE